MIARTTPNGVKSVRPRAVALSAVVVAAATAGVVSLTATGSGAAPAATEIVIDSVTHEVFDPASAQEIPAHAASVIWSIWARRAGADTPTIPDQVHAEFGRLTIPMGDGSYRVHALPVWAFSVDHCPAGNDATVQQSCVDWLFLDATTGEEVDQIQAMG